MKKMLMSIAFIFCLCCCMCGVNANILLANSFEVNNSVIEVTDGITHLSSIGDATYFKNKIYITDKTNNKIFELGNSTNIIYESQIGIPTEISATSDQIAFIKQNDFLYILDLSTNETTQIDKYLKEGELLSFPSIKKITSSATGEIYVITENFVATVVENTDTNTKSLEYFCELNFDKSPLTFSSGGFYVNEDNTTIYFSIDNSIYMIDINTKTITKSNFTISNEINSIKDIAVDNLNNLYILSENKLYKCTTNSCESVDLGITANGFTLDFEKGSCYIFDDTNLYKTTIQDETTNFITAYNNQTPPIELKSITAKSEVVTILMTNKPTTLYSFKSLNTGIASYDLGKNLILLDDTDSKFYYVYDNCAENTQGYLVGYILKSDCEQVSNFSPAYENAKVIVEKAKLFVLPTSVKIDSETYFPNSAQVTHGTTLQLVSSPTLPIDKNGTQFYAVKYNQNGIDYICYIDTRTVIDVTLDTAIDNILVSNASTRAEVVVYQDNELTIEQETLAKNTSVTILETTNGISKIEYLSNGELKTGFVKQSFLNDGNLTTTQIIGICLMIISLILAIIIAICLSMNNKKKKQKPIQ